MRLIHRGTGTSWHWYTGRLGRHGTGTQGDWDVMTLVHGNWDVTDSTGTQGDWDVTDGTGTQGDWDVTDGTGTQGDWDLMALVHRETGTSWH